jgi:hypothetical protein
MWIEFREEAEVWSLWALLKNIEKTKDQPKELNDTQKIADFREFIAREDVSEWHKVRFNTLQESDLYNNWEATRPQMSMINEKLNINIFWAYLRKKYLDKNPADIVWLQQCLNKMIDGFKPNTTGEYLFVGWDKIIRVQDEFSGKQLKRKWLKTFLDEQQAQYPQSNLKLEWWNGKVGHIKEDGKFGPQTYAVFLFFKDAYLKSNNDVIQA